MTPLGTLLDWAEAMTYRQGLVGAALGSGLTLIHFAVDGAPENSEDALISVLAGAFLGCYWMIHITVGIFNGYARPIRWGGAVLGLFMLACSMGHDRDTMAPYLSLIAGVGVGTLAGAMLPLAFFRLRGRLEPKCKMRRFGLLLAYPSNRFHKDNPRSLVSDSDPLETRCLLREQWEIYDRDDLDCVIDRLLSEDRLAQTVEVVRWAVTDHMLSKSEGWNLVEDAGRRATQLYQDWSDFSANDPVAEHLRESVAAAMADRRGLWKARSWPKA